MEILSTTPLILLLTSITFVSTPLALPNPNTNNFHSPAATIPRRKRAAYETCEKTYGGGSVMCGDVGKSHFRYDPSKGEGEDPQTCAQRLNFVLPPSLSGSSSTASQTTTATSSRTTTATVAFANAAGAGIGIGLGKMLEETPSASTGKEGIIVASVSASGSSTGSTGKPVITVPATSANGTLGKVTVAINGTKTGSAEFQGVDSRGAVEGAKWVIMFVVLGVGLGFVF